MSREFRIENCELRNGSLTKPTDGCLIGMVLQWHNSKFSIFNSQ